MEVVVGKNEGQCVGHMSADVRGLPAGKVKILITTDHTTLQVHSSV